MDKDLNCNEHALSKFIECLDWFSWLSCGIPNQRQTQNQLPNKTQVYVHRIFEGYMPCPLFNY